jgi:hypothetical protein
MAPGEQLLIHRVYAACAGLTAVIGIALGVMMNAPIAQRLPLIVGGVVLFVYVVRALRFKKPPADPPPS